MILVLDNYDSFTYNLVQYLGELGAAVEVARNDALTVEDVAQLAPAQIVISPGPGSPDGAGISLALIERFHATIPILGVCLGHQAIGQAFGGTVARARKPMHGKTSAIHHDGRGVFRGLEPDFQATRYHSLAVLADGFPADLEVSARAEDGEIMGLRHRRFAVEGVQFHPESILTGQGKALLRNFLELPAAPPTPGATDTSRSPGQSEGAGERSPSETSPTTIAPAIDRIRSARLPAAPRTATALGLRELLF